MNAYYVNLNKRVRNNTILTNLLHYYKYLSYIIILMYAYLLVITLVHHHFNIIKLIEDAIFYKPLITLIIITELRKLRNKPRPFEVYHFQPVIEHDPGHSWPSRHSASSLIITLMFFPHYPVLFITGLCLTFLIGISRVLSGVHFIEDILSAYLIALVLFII